MQEVFMEWLDQIYWKGYAETFREEEPGTFQRQLTEFSTIYKTSENEISNALSHGKGCGTVRTSKYIRYRKRGRNKDQNNY